MRMDGKQKLWYQKPAQDWNEALPLGNGRLGAMVYGCVFQEKLQMNEDSVWYGGYVDRNNPDAAAYLPRIREAILQNRLDEAHEMASFALSGIPDSQRSYQSLGEVLIGFLQKEQVFSGYRRELDLETALMNIRYQVDGVQYNRELFCSCPDNVTVMRITADKEKSVNLHCLLRRGDYLPAPAEQKAASLCLYSNAKFFDHVERISDNQVMLFGDGGKNGIEFCFSVKAQVKGGSCQVIGEHIVIRDADEAVLYISACTSFREKDFRQSCMNTLEHASRKEYGQLRKRHVEDYRRLFSRVSIKLDDGGKDFSFLPTDERLKAAGQNNDSGFISQYFQFCRYLMISSSRPGSLPANLQGIWCREYAPSWDSKFTININTEMNYWPVEAANLSECHLPLFDLLCRLVENGRKTAREMYGCRGFVAHHNTDIWADSAPQDIVTGSSFWPLGGAWLALHIWEHYSFTRDKCFLEKYYYILKEASLFFVDYFMEEDGMIMTCPSSSPENVFVKGGRHYSLTTSCTVDFEILRHLFLACIRSAALLERDKDFSAELSRLMERFPKRKLGSYGQLLEWQEEYGEIDPGHRHFSHLFSLCPGNLIDVEQTPELAEACRKSITYRLEHGSAHTGWSRAWVINFFARLREPQNVWKHLSALFRYSTIANLFNSHPPFQIDGNFGSLNAICEMFVQSQNKLVLLPALPEQLHTGEVTGLRARGDLTISLRWKMGRLEKAGFSGPAGEQFSFWYDGKEFKAVLSKEGKTEFWFA